MKEVKRYLSEDGWLFDDENKCLKHEKLIMAIKEIESKLPNRPKDDGCNFSNGEGYLQHDQGMIDKAMVDLLKVSSVDKEYWDKPEFLDNPFRCRFGVIGRIIDDSGSPIHSLWNRFMCMDENYREYGQCYYATHQSDATGGCLNTGEKIH